MSYVRTGIRLQLKRSFSWLGAGLLVALSWLDGAGVGRAAQPARAQKPNQASAARTLNLIGHGGPVRAIASDPATGRILTGSFDYAMMLWHVAESGPPRKLARFDDHANAVSAVAFHPNGRLGLAASDDGNVHIWDLSKRLKVGLLAGHTGKILGLALDAGGQRAATASWDRTVRVWDLVTRRTVTVIRGHKGPVNAVAFTADGSKLLTASYDGTLRLWNSATGAPLRIVIKHGWGINVLRRLDDKGLFVFGALDGASAVVSIAENRIVHRFPQHERPVLSLAVLAKPGLIATGGGDGRIRVYRQGDWKPIESYRSPYGPVWALAFVDNGARLYFGGLDDFATAWQVSPREPPRPVDGRFPRRFQVASAEVSLGERQFARKCSVCHTLRGGDANRAGPTLDGVFGRRAGSLPGYPYSDALKGAKLIWDAKTLGKLFELGPHVYTPGSKMPLQRIADKAMRDALIAYLKVATSKTSGPTSKRAK